MAAALYAPLVLVGQGIALPAHAENALPPLRPVVSKPLQAAQDLAKEKKYTEALAKVAEADAAADKTADEVYMIDRVRASIAAVAGDNQLAISSFEKVVDSKRLSPEEEIKFVEALGSLYSKQKEYAKAIPWIERYFKSGGNDPEMRNLLIRDYYFNNEFAKAAQELRADIQADEKAGRTPSEASLKLLISCAVKQNDKNGYIDTLEKFIAYYPKKEYWGDLLNRVTAKPTFSDRLALDAYRLKRAVGQMSGATDYMAMSQLALLAGFPGEAKAVIDEGFASGALSPAAAGGKQARLRDDIYKAAAEDARALGSKGADDVKKAQGLLNQGFAYVTAGDREKGIAMMERSLRMGGLKRPEDAKLLLGYAYVLEGRKDQALQTFKTVRGADGTADLARCWILHLGQLNG